jgi:hypothetical protein
MAWYQLSERTASDIYRVFLPKVNAGRAVSDIQGVVFFPRTPTKTGFRSFST